MMAYGQTAITEDLYAAHDAAGRQIIDEAGNVQLHELTTSQPYVTYEKSESSCRRATRGVAAPLTSAALGHAEESTRMKTAIGLEGVRIYPVVEQQGPFFDAMEFFPTLTKELLEENRWWLQPTFVDPVSLVRGKAAINGIEDPNNPPFLAFGRVHCR